MNNSKQGTDKNKKEHVDVQDKKETRKLGNKLENRKSKAGGGAVG